ncbi:polysaccharide lyase family 3 protein [Plenodomus tracheiphilus IPT5]|uniref:Pectate lyase n=1 Tax=Plenodomus tracheiphilus IPT5 TaxID=1408161 RepID=A0A6A7BCU3_9PLEO|nr:polysaccharide lyase family 3 protein [Plenodomus tracheiphilus IPT5]
MHGSSLLVAALAGLTVAEVQHPHQPRAATNTALQTTFPKPSTTTNLPAARTIPANSNFDGGLKQWDRSTNTCSGQDETGEADAVFILENGAVLSNVIIGPNNGEGVHCRGTCTLNNELTVWWVNVCEDAATFKQGSGTSYVNGGGAKGADDKVFQHNGSGTVAVKNFYAESIGKLYRSCGNCGTQYGRKSSFDGIKVKTGKLVAGVNGNLGDSTTIKNSCLLDTKAICDLFKGVTSGEPTKTASGPDGKTCATSGVKTSGC